MSFRKDLKEFRKKAGLSQQEFSNYFEIPLPTIQGWEAGRRTPPAYVLKLIRKVWEYEYDKRVEEAEKKFIEKIMND